MFQFWLGTDEAGWLARFPAGFMVSRTRLARCRNLPRAIAPWVLDSGGFTELSRHGRWTVTEREYVAEVRRYRDEVGSLVWAAPQDWMSEPDVIAGSPGGGMIPGKVGTGLTVADHRARTVDNFLRLRDLAADLPIIPVVQGWHADDYLRCADLYDRRGVDLAAEPVVGIGSVCRRGSVDQAAAELAVRSLRPFCGPLHGFGVSLDGLARYGDALGSSDSLAWSAQARRSGHLSGCPHPRSARGRPFTPAHCPGCALTYRNAVAELAGRPRQLRFDLV